MAAKARNIDEAVERMFDQYFGPAKAALENAASAESSATSGLDSLDEAARGLFRSAEDEETPDASRKPELDRREETQTRAKSEAAKRVDAEEEKKVPSPSAHIITPSMVAQVPERGYVKAANWLWDSLPKQLDSIYDWAVYTYLYRLTIGYGRSDCIVSITTIQSNLSIGKNTVIRSVASLRSKGLLTTGDVCQDGTHITLLAPVSLAGLPSQGSPQQGIPTTGRLSQGSPSQGIPAEGSQGLPCQGIPTAGRLTRDQLSPSLPCEGIPWEGHIKDNVLKDNNKQTDVDCCESYLKKRGFTVPRSRIETWIEEGVTLSRIKEVSIFVSDWADNPTGALIDAIENKREVSPEVLEAAASSEAAILQVAEEAKRQREEEEWLAAEVARIGPEGMKKIREQAEAECKNNWVYQKTEIEAIKQSIVDSKVKEMLLSQRQ
jgi:hypothetical protein